MELGAEPDEKISHAAAEKVVANLHLNKLAEPQWCNIPARTIRFCDLPTRPPAANQRALVSHLLDVCIGVDDVYADKDAIAQKMISGEVAELPGVLPPKAAIEQAFAMNIAIVPSTSAPGKVDVLKHFVFDDKVQQNVANGVLHGEGKWVEFGSNKRTGIKPFMYMWQRMGGFQVHFWSIARASATAKPLEEPDAINAGYDYIVKYAPSRKGNCAQQRWVDIERQRIDSHIFGWSVGRITAAIASMRSADQQAGTVEEFPILFQHLSGWFKKIMLEHLCHMDDASLLLLGVEGMGEDAAGVHPKVCDVAPSDLSAGLP